MRVVQRYLWRPSDCWRVSFKTAQAAPEQRWCRASGRRRSARTRAAAAIRSCCCCCFLQNRSDGAGGLSMAPQRPRRSSGGGDNTTYSPSSTQQIILTIAIRCVFGEVAIRYIVAEENLHHGGGRCIHPIRCSRSRSRRCCRTDSQNKSLSESSDQAPPERVPWSLVPCT